MRYSFLIFRILLFALTQYFENVTVRNNINGAYICLFSPAGSKLTQTVCAGGRGGLLNLAQTFVRNSVFSGNYGMFFS